MINISCTAASAANNLYRPPALGNGDLSLQIDFEGAMSSAQYGNGSGDPVGIGIRRAGYRYNAAGFAFVPFGRIEQTLPDAGELTDWSQTLNVTEAYTETVCRYASGLEVKSRVFCCLHRNIVVLEKTFSCPAKVEFRHVIGKPWRMALRREGTRLFYNVDEGQYEGCMTLESPELAADAEGTLSGTVDHCTVYFALDETGPFDARKLFAGHCAAWSEYWREGFVELPEPKMQEVYMTAQYHLRISTTRWSIPTGLFDTHWHGKYFAFDEYFALRGLLSSGHISTAKRVPDFRFAILPQALNRGCRYGGNTQEGIARYCWEALEDGAVEGAPAGIWLDHIFHMAHIALSARDYVLFTGDHAYLRENAYPVMRGCAQFFSCCAMERWPDGRVILGSCTDLERLRAGRRNAYMSTCGAIAALEAAAEAADVLKLDAELAANWRHDAQGLRATLPNDGTKYIPYPGCPQKSVAMYSGTFPYPVLPPEDPMQLAAITDFEVNGKAYGNMYPQGSKTCAWYAAWQAVIAARFGDAKKALCLLRETVEDTGCFSEIFEIHEVGSRAWFTTAEGTFVQAVNELFVQVGPDGSVKELPAVPKAWKHYAFRLPAANGKWVQKSQ